MNEFIERRDSSSTDRPPASVNTDVASRAIAVEPTTEVRRSFSARFVPDAVVAAVVGVALVTIGLLAIIRGGFDDSMSTPLVEVFGVDHTTTLGLVEIGVGLVLPICGLVASRSGALLVGTLLGIAALVGAVQTASFREPLGLETTFAWLLLVAGAVVVVAALLLPRVVTNSSTSQVRHG